MKTRMIAMVLGLALLALPVMAQEVEEEYDMEAAVKKVAELLKQSEKLLVETAKGGSAGEAATAGAEAKKAIEELLEQSRQSGQDAADKMTEILENAPQCQGGGQGQEEQKPSEQDKQQAKDSQEEVDKRDPKNSADRNEPNSGEKSESEPESTAKKPPESAKDKPAAPNPDEDWMATLPEKIRQAVKNGEWDRIPARYRELIQEYTKRMAELESERKRD